MLGVVALATVLALAGAEAAGWSFLRAPLARALSTRAGVPVALEGAFTLHLLRPPLLEVEHLRVGAGQQVPVGDLLVADGLQARWHWMDLWRTALQGRVLTLQSLQARNLELTLVRLADGRASWQLGNSAAALAPPRPPQIEQVQLGRGLVRLVDEPTQTRALITLFSDAAGAGLGATAVGTFRALPLDLQAHADQVLPLVGSTAPENDVRVQAQGAVGASQISFTGTAGAVMGARRLSGELHFRGPSLAAVGEPLRITLPRTPAFDLQGRLSHDSGRWQLLARRFTVGQSQLGGDFSYDTHSTPPMLSGRLTGSRLLWADLGPAVGTAGEGMVTHPKDPARSRVLPDRSFDLPSLRTMQADLQVRIDLLDFGVHAVAPLHAVTAHLVLADALLHLRELNAQAAGGRITGTSSLDGRGDPARWAADLEFKGVDLAGWVRGVQTPAAAASAPAATQTGALKQQRQAAHAGGDQAVQAYLTGELSGNVHVVGQGRSTAQILSTLDGRAQATLRDGSMSHLMVEAAGLDLAQWLGVLVRGDRPLPLRCARAQLALRHGVGTAQNTLLDNSDSTINVTGQVDLRNEALDLRATVHPKDKSPLALRTPLRVTGTLAHPQVGIDGGRLAPRALAAVALGLLAGPAALLPFVDLGDKTQADPCAAAGVPDAPAAPTARAASAPAAPRAR